MRAPLRGTFGPSLLSRAKTSGTISNLTFMPVLATDLSPANDARQKGHLIRVPLRLPVIGVEATVGEGTVPRDTISARKV